MTQDEIRAQRDECVVQIRRAKVAYEMAVGGPKGVLGALRIICKHPSGHETSCMGDTGFYCPDCGYSR